jgi:biotin carboxyl carrier protein
VSKSAIGMYGRFTILDLNLELFGLYKVSVNGKKSTEFSGAEEKINLLDISNDGNDGYHILSGKKRYAVHILELNRDAKMVSLLINGNKYTVTLEDRFDLLLKSLGIGGNVSKQLKLLKAPMPGLVLEILVEPGKAVNAGDPLMILEAMKMENVLKSTGQAIVKSVEVAKGAPVEKNQVLIHFE